MEYKEWLKGIKGFTDRTVEVYSKYAFELEASRNDYKELIKRYKDKSNSTKRLILSACKNYYIFKGDVRSSEISLPKKSIFVSDYVTFEDYERYIKKINNKTRLGYQKYIIVRLLFETGIRSSELLWLTKTNIKGNRLKILGKGNKERYIMVSRWLSFELAEYVGGINTERLFPFTYKNLYQRIAMLDNERNLSPHMFRHGYAKYCFEKGISIYDISISMGHSSIDTTAKYINKKSEDVSIFTIF